MVVQGIIRGNSIELTEPPQLAEGTLVWISVIDRPYLLSLPLPQRESLLLQFLGGWQDDPELATLLEDIDRDRHQQISEPASIDLAP